MEYHPDKEPQAGVIVFFPLAEERKGCVRVVHELGVRLAASGVALLCFDYAGCGESPGSFASVTWEGLEQGGRSAVTVAQERWPGTPLFGLGIRLGALLLLEVASPALSPLERILFWQPVFDGSGWLREAMRRSRFRKTGDPADGRGNGWLDLDGYALSPVLQAGLSLERHPERLNPRALDVTCIQIGHRNAPAPELLRQMHSLGGDVFPLEMPPFWLESGVVDTAPLVEMTVKALFRDPK